MSKIKPWACFDCRIMMKIIDEDHCKCPVCGTEVWFKYDESQDDIEELMQDNLNKHQINVYDAMLGGQPVKGSGSKVRGRSKKALLQKPSTQELYNKLTK